MFSVRLKSSKLIMKVFLILTIAYSSLVQGGINPSSAGPKTIILDFNKKDALFKKTEQMYDAFFKDLPSKSKVKVKRGDSEFAIDLNAENINKIKSGDVIYLEAGKYENFPEIKVDGLTIQGMGKDKTVIGKMLTTRQKTVVSGESLLFADLTLSRPFFNNLKDKNGQKEISNYTIVKSRVLAGDVSFSASRVPAVVMNIYFSEIINLQSQDKDKSTIKKGIYSYFETFDMKVWKPAKIIYFDDDNNVGHDLVMERKTAFSQNYKTAKKNYLKNQFSEIDPNIVKSAFANIQNRTERNRDIYQDNKKANKNLNFAFDYLSSVYGFNLSDEELAAANKLRLLAQKSDVEKRYMSAALASGLAIKKISNTSIGKEIEKEYTSYLTKAADLHSCNRNKGSDSIHFNRKIADLYPILNLDGEKSKCKLDYITNISQQTQRRLNTGSYSTPIYTETEESKRRRFAIQDAANEAKKQQWKAKMAISEDRLSQASKNVSRSMARFGQVGGSQYLIYGKGNFSPKEDPFLKYNLAKAEQKVKSLPAGGNTPDYFVSQKVSTTYTAQNELLYESTLKAEFGNGKKILVKGPFAQLYAAKSCVEANVNGMSAYTGGRNCISLEVNMNPNIYSYISQEILPSFETIFFENRMEEVIVKAKEFAYEGSEENELEGLLLFVGLNLKVDEKRFGDLTHKILGSRLSILDARKEILRQSEG